MCLFLGAPVAYGDITPEEAGVETLGQPTDDWFVNLTQQGAYLFDSASGDMLGMLSLTPYTPAIAVNRNRGEAYAAESYLSRLYRGEREDVFTVYDITTLSPIAEIDVPDKISDLIGEFNIGLLGNGSQVVIYNFTPAQSVSIIDLESRRFAGEIATPGCGMILPVNNASFLMVCGDGSVQLIGLADDGTEAHRTRSDRFFSVEDDAVFDRAARTSTGWLLVTHAGLAFVVSVDGDAVSVSEPWPLVSDEERAGLWRPGGGGLVATHPGSNLAFVLMHQGEADTHHEPGSELWIFDTDKRRRLTRWALDKPWSDVLVLQGERPRLIARTEDGDIQVYDALQQRFERTIEEPGAQASLLQRF